MLQRYFLSGPGRLWAALSALLLSISALPAAPALVWTDIRELSVEGKGWTDTEAFYDRLPARAREQVRPEVWNLSRHSAGMLVRFRTSATNIHARWSLTSANLAMPHMAATGVSGLDLYVRDASGQWRWLAVGMPKAQTNMVQLVNGISAEEREFLLYLPLYNGTASVELGVPEGSNLCQAGDWGPGRRKPIVFYGTSILHGACASRPGMVHSAMLGRRFNWPTINLGFSGNGKMEPELGDLLAELDPAVYVLDCLPNMDGALVAERLEPFVRRLRQVHPRTPIVLVEDRTFANAHLVGSRQAHHEASRAALQRAYRNLKKSGVKHLHYIRGEDLLGTDGEGTVDASHPNDLGFARQAEIFARVLKPLLRRE